MKKLVAGRAEKIICIEEEVRLVIYYMVYLEYGNCPRDRKYKGRIVQEQTFGDALVGGTSAWHP